MEGPLERDEDRVRVTDADRERVAEVLRVAAGEGRLDLDELDRRLEATYAARTYADLVPITHDLPAGPTARGTAISPWVVEGAERDRSVAVLGSLDRTGGWVVPRELSIVAVLGSATLDLREARFAAQEVTITIRCFLGSAQVTVPPHVDVVVEGAGIMGSFSGPASRVRPQLTAESPTVRLRGVAVWGGVAVERKPLRRRDR